MNRLLLCSLLLLPVLPAAAATLTVNHVASDLVDFNPGDGLCDALPLDAGEQCTLRAAVMESNALFANSHDIVLPLDVTIVLDRAGAGDDDVGDLNIHRNVRIRSFDTVAPDDTTRLPLIDASALGSSVFYVHFGESVTLRGMQLEGASANAGAAVFNVGTAQLDHVIVRDTVNAAGAAVYCIGAGATLEVVDSHFSGNVGSQLGAAISALCSGVTVRRSSFRDNRGPTVLGASIFVDDGAALRVEDSMFDGTPLSPPVAGLAAAMGIRAINPNGLFVRNSTLIGFTRNALKLEALAVTSNGVVANSVLADGSFTACEADLAPAGGQPSLSLRYNLIEDEVGCAAFMQSNQTGVEPQLAPYATVPGSVVQARAPDGVFSNLVDNGIAPGIAPPNAEMLCTTTDVHGRPRPHDGNGDGLARCDRGAVELGDPPTFEVNVFDQDLPDPNLADGYCDVFLLSPGAQCTLRAAVMQANASAGVQRIRFAGTHSANIVLTRAAAGDASGGDLDLTESLIIEGRDQGDALLVRISQQVAGERIFDVQPAAASTILMSRLRLSGGATPAASGGALRVGGGAYVLLQRSLLHDHQALHGGAIAVLDGGLVLADVELRNNMASDRGAALYVGTQGAMLVASSSFIDNVDTSVGGGALREAIALAAGAELTMVNSTLTGNSGGVQSDGAILELQQNTIAANQDFGLHVAFGAGNDQLTLRANLLANNGGGDLQLFDTGQADGFNIVNWNLIGDGAGAWVVGSNFAADPLLEAAPVAVPGRIARVLPLRFDVGAGLVSPALDVVPADGNCILSDQRGVLRPQDLDAVANGDGPCDIGAYEAQQDGLFSDGFD